MCNDNINIIIVSNVCISINVCNVNDIVCIIIIIINV